MESPNGEPMEIPSVCVHILPERNLFHADMKEFLRMFSFMAGRRNGGVTIFVFLLQF